MNRRLALGFIILLSLAMPLAADGPAAMVYPPEALPHWIWAGPKNGGQSSGHILTKSLKLEPGFQSADLKFAADFCASHVAINGKTVVQASPFSQTFSSDVTSLLRAGENEIEIGTWPALGPAGVALSIVVRRKDGSLQHLVTNDSWTAVPSERYVVHDRGTVRPELWGFGQRSIALSSFDNYEQWRQATSPGEKKEGQPAGKSPKFWVAPGFAIHQVRTALPDEGSWIAMAFDPQGRLTISKEDKGLLRMTLDDERANVTKVETINDDLLECRGLLYAHDSLYANANNAKSMFRLRDRDGDGKFDEVNKLREFGGGVGHGRNDLALGPDGMIYSIHGDSVAAPEAPLIDHTSPLRDSRRGKPQQEGYVVRTDPDGKQWELVCTGLRNPYGIDFNPAGDLFTYDADNEFDMSTPWYRPTRIWQLNSGSDFGWRVAQGKWPPYWPDRPDNGAPVLEIGKGSPTSVMFGTKCRFPEKYRNAMYALDWAYGRVLAVHMAPRGTTYRCEPELFLQGVPLNVTDIATGPDGAMYLITGGRKTQSSLYRVKYVGGEDVTASLPVSQHEKENEAFAVEARKSIGQLRDYLRTPASADDTSKHVEYALARFPAFDPHIKVAARTVLEQLPPKDWGDKVFEHLGTAENSLAVLRLRDEALTNRVLEWLLFIPKHDYVEVDQIAIRLHAYSNLKGDLPEVWEKNQPAIVKQLAHFWSQLQSETRFIGPNENGIDLARRIAVTLGEWKSPEALPMGLKLLDGPTQEDQLAGLLALRHLKTGWTIDQRKRYFTVLNQGNQFNSGEGMPTFLKLLRTDAVASLSEEEKAALGPLIEDKPIVEEIPESKRELVKQWSLEDLAPLLADDAKPGDARRGESLFREALCFRCHRSGARGPGVGPDLTFVARRFSRRDMCESILTPSKVVAETYRMTQIATISGRVLSGRILSEGDFRSEKVRLSVNPLKPDAIEEVDKKEIEEVTTLETSPMPQGLLDRFTLEEIRDLLAYLEATK